MAFMFLGFLGISLILFHLARVFEQRYSMLRRELLATQDMLRARESRPSAPDKANAPPLSGYAVDGPLVMPGVEASPGPEVFDAGLDLHCELQTDKEPGPQAGAGKIQGISK
jgi:hypothetical protein